MPDWNRYLKLIRPARWFYPSLLQKQKLRQLYKRMAIHLLLLPENSFPRSQIVLLRLFPRRYRQTRGQIVLRSLSCDRASVDVLAQSNYLAVAASAALLKYIESKASITFSNASLQVGAALLASAVFLILHPGFISFSARANVY